jgi:hypothetical protein
LPPIEQLKPRKGRQVAPSAATRLALALAVNASSLAADPPLHAVPFTDVRLTDDFWLPRQQTGRVVTLPHCLAMCETTGRLRNFDIAAGKSQGKFEGYFFNDSDVYKVVEGAANYLAIQPDPKLDAQLDDLIARLAAAQQPDGYLNTYYTVAEPGQRWTDLKVRHELYCAGHLIEAAVAHFKATGKRNFLDVATRLADHIDSVFGPDKRRDVCGHEEIELALIRLWRATGEQRYLDLARFFIDERGNPHGRESYGDYCQDHAPICQQTEAVGHAVRAMYLYSAVTDLAMLSRDESCLRALDRLWTDLTSRKLYITGGIGSSSHNEGFTTAYDLPNDTAYAETCAGIGLVLWSHRLSLLHADAQYADVLERALYNNFLASTSLEGDKFYYVNPLASRGAHHRQPWYACACCPPNIVRTLSSIGQYVYARSDRAIYVNLYVGSDATLRLLQGLDVRIRQQTHYPWDGEVKLTVDPSVAAEFDLNLRIPGWCTGGIVRVNGQPFRPPAIQKGYLRVARTWSAGDVVELTLPMPVERIAASPRVKADVGRAAIQRGPLVYCLEQVDNKDGVRNLMLPREGALRTEFRDDILGGVMIVKGHALRTVPPDPAEPALYRRLDPGEAVDFIAVPYFGWDNRRSGEMIVWLPESAALVELPPVAWMQANASHCFASDTPLAMHDRQEPADSCDHSIPRFTWWPKKGSVQWVQYVFDKPRTVTGVEVYWFDDRRVGGGCRVPASWKLLVQRASSAGDDEWRPIDGVAEFGAAADRYNAVTFEPIEATGLRIEAQLADGFSGGILEWRVATR